MDYELRILLEQINSCTSKEELVEIQNTLNESISNQIQKIDNLHGEIRVVRFNDYNKSIIVEEGKKLDFEIKGYLLQAKLIDSVSCHRGKTKKFTTLVNQLKEKHQAIVLPSTERLMID